MAVRQGLRRTGLRCEILAHVAPGPGTSADTLKRKVALARSLVPGDAGWRTFNTSFSRALRLLEAAGVIALERESGIFEQACVGWVSLTPAGERERARAVPAIDPGLGRLRPETLGLVAEVQALLAAASDAELAKIEALVNAERSRRIPAHSRS